MQYFNTCAIQGDILTLTIVTVVLGNGHILSFWNVDPIPLHRHFLTCQMVLPPFQISGNKSNCQGSAMEPLHHR